MTIREEYEAREREFLRAGAALSCETKGRRRYETPCDIRTEYQRDRDRVIHSNAFRRMKQKTQVFLAPTGDHYRTRLTHTLEVAQIARTISRALRLNEDLTEAIALAHDLGHTPFGHAGERALDRVCTHGFVHSRQSVRVVDRLEKDGEGLNLTYEVRNGIACHTDGRAVTLEGRVVLLSDKLAYVNHDIDDAIRAGVLEEGDLPQECVRVLGHKKSARINTVIHSVVENSTDDIRMSPEVDRAQSELRGFLFRELYVNPTVKSEEVRAEGVVTALYEYFLEHSNEMPRFYREIARQEDLPRAVCDYIAGMTDSYAVRTYRQLFLPKAWTK